MIGYPPWILKPGGLKTSGQKVKRKLKTNIIIIIYIYIIAMIDFIALIALIALITLIALLALIALISLIALIFLFWRNKGGAQPPRSVERIQRQERWGVSGATIRKLPKC